MKNMRQPDRPDVGRIMVGQNAEKATRQPPRKHSQNFYDVEFDVFRSVVVCGLTFFVAAFLTVFNAGFCARAAARVSSAS
jgi:hypothetical protein